MWRSLGGSITRSHSTRARLQSEAGKKASEVDFRAALDKLTTKMQSTSMGNANKSNQTNKNNKNTHKKQQPQQPQQSQQPQGKKALHRQQQQQRQQQHQRAQAATMQQLKDFHEDAPKVSALEPPAADKSWLRELERNLAFGDEVPSASSDPTPSSSTFSSSFSSSSPSTSFTPPNPSTPSVILKRIPTKVSTTPTNTPSPAAPSTPSSPTVNLVRIASRSRNTMKILSHKPAPPTPVPSKTDSSPSPKSKTSPKVPPPAAPSAPSAPEVPLTPAQLRAKILERHMAKLGLIEATETPASSPSKHVSPLMSVFPTSTTRLQQAAASGSPGPALSHSERKARLMMTRFESAGALPLDPVSVEVILTPAPEDINRLATGLQSVLDRPGVHIVKNAIPTKITDFEGTISEEFLHITQPQDIDTTTIPPFITSSRDKHLLKAAKEAQSSFMGSTSSTTGLLAQFIQLLLAHRPRNMDSFSGEFDALPRNFTQATRKGTCVVLRRRGKVLGIDNLPKWSPPSNQILIELGKSLERMFTMEPQNFRDIMVKSEERKRGAVKRLASEPSMCVKMNSLMVRAQLDCQHQNAQMAGVFDLKTRAVLPIRLDCKNHLRYTGYHITAYNGLLYSFEREFFDMVRSTMLKFNLQARIGQMTGIMVAYHNTQKIFGFEYVSLESMDEHLYGSTVAGKLLFNVSTKLLDSSLTQIFQDKPRRPYDQVRLISHSPKGAKYCDLFVEYLPENAFADHPDPVIKAHYAPYGVDAMTVDELKERLKQLGADTSGLRPSLVSRLESALHPPYEAELPGVPFLAEQIEAGNIKHYRLWLYLVQRGASLDSLHDAHLEHFEEQDPQKFAELNGLEIKFQLEALAGEVPTNMSARRFYHLLRDSIDDDDGEERAKVAREIPLNFAS